MAKNTGKGSREGEVRERNEVKNPKTGDYVKRDTKSGQFLDVKCDTKSGQFLGCQARRPSVEGRAQGA